MNFSTPNLDAFGHFILQKEWEVDYRVSDVSSCWKTRKAYRISYRRGKTYPWFSILAEGDSGIEAAEKAAELALIAVGEMKPKDSVLNKQEA